MALVRSRERHLGIRHVERRIARNERSRVTIDTEPEVQRPVRYSVGIAEQLFARSLSSPSRAQNNVTAAKRPRNPSAGSFKVHALLAREGTNL